MAVAIESEDDTKNKEELKSLLFDFDKEEQQQQ